MRILSRRLFGQVVAAVAAAVALAAVPAVAALPDDVDFRLERREGGFAVTFRQPAVWPVRRVGDMRMGSLYVPASDLTTRRYVQDGQVCERVCVGRELPRDVFCVEVLLSTLTHGAMHAEVKSVSRHGYVVECELRLPLATPRCLLWVVEAVGDGLLTFAATVGNQPVMDAHIDVSVERRVTITAMAVSGIWAEPPASPDLRMVRKSGYVAVTRQQRGRRVMILVSADVTGWAFSIGRLEASANWVRLRESPGPESAHRLTLSPGWRVLGWGGPARPEPDSPPVVQVRVGWDAPLAEATEPYVWRDISSPPRRPADAKYHLGG